MLRFNFFMIWGKDNLLVGFLDFDFKIQRSSFLLGETFFLNEAMLSLRFMSMLCFNP